METVDTPIKILHIEDDESDSQLVQIYLKKEEIDYKYFLVDTEIQFREFLSNEKIDIILSDYNLPGYSGLDAMHLAKTEYPHIPFIFVSGAMGEEVAIESLLKGATDYVLKNRLSRLAPAIKRALREARLQHEYKKAIDNLRKREEQYRLLVEGMNEGLMLTDMNDTILFVNQQTCDITGFKQEDLIGKKCALILFDSENGHLILEKNKLRKKGIKDIYEITLTRKDKAKIWIRCSGSPVFDDKGKFIGTIGVFENISERKKAEEERNKLTQQLVEAKDKAEESDRLKSAFLANISHEIRTPMNGILGFAELLKNQDLNSELQMHYINVIEKSGYRMLNIINDLVDISKIESGQMNVSTHETNVNLLLKDLLIFFTPEANSKNLKLSITTDLTDEDSIIVTDQNKLTQIMTNLIKNALKFTKSGYINFGYTSMGIKKSKVGLSKNPTLIRFFVEDTGVGIPSDQLSMVFERFRQGSISLTRAYEGAGLGLSISKAFVEMLDGTIWVESEVGNGSTFYFELPLNNQKTAKTPLPENEIQEKQISKPCCVLVSEDDSNSLFFVKTLLEFENISVIEANTGKMAVEMVRQHPEIDLVLMDLKMPEMDGFEATRQIKLLRPELPVIAQTAYTFADEKGKAEQAGCNDYIAKPIRRISLMEKFRKFNLR